MPSTRRLALGIEAVSWGFVLLGLLLPLTFRTAPFAMYRDALAAWATGTGVLPEADTKLLGLMLGITGGSIAGKWIVHALLARGPLAEGRAWARDLTLAGLAAWFLVDSTASLLLGAAFNVWMINLAPLLIVGLPLVLARNRFDDDGAAPPSWTPASRACFWTAMAGAATGPAIAFGGGTALFSPWFAGLEAAHYGGAPLDSTARSLALFFLGPIGGCAFAQFLMLAGFVRRDGATGRAATAGAASIAGWCAIDSAWGLAHDGLFNLRLVNLPALAMTLPAWLLLARRSRDRRAD